MVFQLHQSELSFDLLCILSTKFKVAASKGFVLKDIFKTTKPYAFRAAIRDDQRNGKRIATCSLPSGRNPVLYTSFKPAVLNVKRHFSNVLKTTKITPKIGCLENESNPTRDNFWCFPFETTV